MAEYAVHPIGTTVQFSTLDASHTGGIATRGPNFFARL